MYTLENISDSKSYSILKNHNLTDLDIVNYYKQPIKNRGQFFNKIKLNLTKKVETQKCTIDTVTVNIDSVREMALDYMSRDWVYRGKKFNMNSMGWTFFFNDRKGSLGLCSHRDKRIYLSQWFIENGSREFKMWVNTMVHEISHAINRELGGKGHDWQWKHIFESFGGNGERTSGDVKFDDLLKNPISKYTLVCPNGHTRASHKKKRRLSACGTCCKELNNGRYSEKYEFKQIKNY
jgi:hypothetical protein